MKSHEHRFKMSCYSNLQLSLFIPLLFPPVPPTLQFSCTSARPESGDRLISYPLQLLLAVDYYLLFFKFKTLMLLIHFVF